MPSHGYGPGMFFVEFAYTSLLRSPSQNFTVYEEKTFFLKAVYFNDYRFRQFFEAEMMIPPNRLHLCENLKECALVFYHNNPVY